MEVRFYGEPKIPFLDRLNPVARAQMIRGFARIEQRRADVLAALDAPVADLDRTLLDAARQQAQGYK